MLAVLAVEQVVDACAERQAAPDLPACVERHRGIARRGALVKAVHAARAVVDVLLAHSRQQLHACRQAALRVARLQRGRQRRALGQAGVAREVEAAHSGQRGAGRPGGCDLRVRLGFQPELAGIDVFHKDGRPPMKQQINPCIWKNGRQRIYLQRIKIDLLVTIF